MFRSNQRCMDTFNEIERCESLKDKVNETTNHVINNNNSNVNEEQTQTNIFTQDNFNQSNLTCFSGGSGDDGKLIYQLFKNEKDIEITSQTKQDWLTALTAVLVFKIKKIYKRQMRRINKINFL